MPTYSGGEPYQYVYSVGLGWSWVAAPWIWGYGPWPWFGVAGPWAFAWYGWGFWSYPYHYYGYRPGYAYGYRGPGFSPAGAVRPGAPVAAPVGVGGAGYAPSGGGHGGGGFSPRGGHR
jgi:23S rRNA pseudouridine2605 synthase